MCCFPSCESLGYTDTVSQCFDTSNVLKCPFDTTKGKCLKKGPSVGDLKYSLKSTNHEGWILCDGTQYKQSQYPELYNLLKLNFCHKYTSRGDTAHSTSNCGADYFAVPDYRGFFLRAIANSKSTSSVPGSQSSTYSAALYYKGDTNVITTPYVPQYERLPNIGGTFTADDEGIINGASKWWNMSTPGTLHSTYANCTAASPCQKRFWQGGFSFYSRAKDSDGYTNPSGPGGDGGVFVQFQAKNSNAIYDGVHVSPAAYGAYVFIYSGKL